MKTNDTTKTATVANVKASNKKDAVKKTSNVAMSAKTAKASAKKNTSADELMANSVELGRKLIAKMRRGIVEFTFINRLGKHITTAGTLIKSKIPTTRKVAGAVKPRDNEHVVFYDTRHGVRRQFNRNQVVAIFA